MAQPFFTGSPKTQLTILQGPLTDSTILLNRFVQNLFDD